MTNSTPTPPATAADVAEGNQPGGQKRQPNGTGSRRKRFGTASLQVRSIPNNSASDVITLRAICPYPPVGSRNRLFGGVPASNPAQGGHASGQYDDDRCR